MVHFVGFGGPATSLAPGRGTYGLARSAAFQGCKDRRKILKWRHMRAFSGSVSEWCGQAEAARKPPRLPPSDRPASARTQAASAPASAWRPGGFRLASGRLPLSVRAASVSVRRKPRGSRNGFRSASARLPFRSGGSRAEAARKPPHHSRVPHHACAERFLRHILPQKTAKPRE